MGFHTLVLMAAMAAIKSNRRHSAGPRLDKRRRPVFCPESLARGSHPVKATKASAWRNGTRSKVLVRLIPTNGPTPTMVSTRC